MISALLLLLAAYVAGAVPASHWTGLVFYGKDLRALGSQNLGATNAQRILGWRAAIPVATFDIFKGFAPALWFPQLAQVDDQAAASWGIAYGAAAILGHCFSVFVRFRGGKGVGTSAGVLLALAPGVVPVGAATWLLVLLISRKVSVASMTAALAVPIAGMVVIDAEGLLLAFFVALAAFVVWAHRANIRRLLAGEEPSIGGRG